MTGTKFILGWLLLTIVLFPLTIKVVQSIKVHKGLKLFKRKCMSNSIEKMVRITKKIIEIELNKEISSPIICYCGKINYHDNSKNKDFPIEFLFITNPIKGHVNITFINHFSKNKKDRVISYDIENILNCGYKKVLRNLSRKQKEYLLNMGIFEESSIECTIKGIFIDPLKDMDIFSSFNNDDLEEKMEVLEL